MNPMRICFLFMGIIISTILWSQDSLTVNLMPKQTMYYFKLGSTIIPLKTLQYGNSRQIVIINLHDDETTSVDAAKKVLQDEGGLLIKLENKNQRLIEFILNKRQYKIDPNRIFSRKGIIATLKKNKSYSAFAVKKVQAFASFIIKKIPAKCKRIIAVHNNDEGRLTIHSYERGGENEKDVKKVIVGSEDPDNFYFTTDKTLFKRLSSLHYNVVLQENNKARDDGSLSIYCGRKKIIYVNVEVKLGQLERQSEMLKALFLHQTEF